MKIYRYSMRIYKYSMRFRVPDFDQSDHSICYNYDLSIQIPVKLEFFHTNVIIDPDLQ